MLELALRTLVNGILGALGGGLLLGLFAWAVSGSAGVVNGLGIGAVIGFTAGLLMAGQLSHAAWWTEVANRIGRARRL